MGTIGKPEQAFLFAAVFSSDEKLIAAAGEQLESDYGQIIRTSGIFSFDFTDYYTEEMGSGLKKEIFLFSREIEPSEIADIKIRTNDIELDLSGRQKRSVNIDPGYITQAKVILATTKNYTHRIYIGKGIYCEITLTFHKGTFRTNPWTYRDYAQKDIVEFFNSSRASLFSSKGTLS